jgi:hypothetical protein
MNMLVNHPHTTPKELNTIGYLNAVTLNMYLFNMMMAVAAVMYAAPYAIAVKNSDMESSCAVFVSSAFGVAMVTFAARGE